MFTYKHGSLKYLVQRANWPPIVTPGLSDSNCLAMFFGDGGTVAILFPLSHKAPGGPPQPGQTLHILPDCLGNVYHGVRVIGSIHG